jgi:hypothetical protein
MANGIIGLDNITNIATGLDKELLDMTYSDKYYRDVIQPAKLGKGPMPSRMEMISQSLKNFGPFKAMGIGMRPDIYGERAMPTKAAQKFLNTVGSAAKFGINRVAPLFGIFGSTELGADEPITQAMRDEIDITDELDDYYEKGEMMDNVADAPRDSLLSRILELGKGLGGGIVDAAKGAGNVISNLGIVGALRNLDQFKNLSLSDQNFILSQAGGNRPAKDRFGYNIRSAFGNYATLVGNRADIAKDRLARGLPLRAIDQYYLNKEKERAAAAKADFDRLNAIRQQRDADSMSGGAGETTSGTFGSSVNDPSTFSDYS